MSQQVKETTNIYALYLFKKYMNQIVFNVYNINLIMFIIWTVIYYLLYYRYIVQNILNYPMQSLDDNVITNYNQLLIKRFLPYCGYILILIIIQYFINTSMMRNVCKQDIYIDYSSLNIFTLFPWFIVLMGLFFVIYKYPSIKGIYSKTVVHKIFDMLSDSNSIIKTIIRQKDLPNDEEYNAIRDLFQTLQTNPNNVNFIQHIHISNYKEYIKLMDPILEENNNGSLNNFLVFLIKKDIISEFIWVLKIGILISLFVYIRLKNLKCTNSERTEQEYIDQYLKEKMATCDENCDFENKNYRNDNL